MSSELKTVNSLFEQPWWLDAVAPGQWDAIEIRQGEKTVARLPYVRMRQFGFRVLGMPPYTQTLGYWTEKTGSKNEKHYAREKDMITALINGLPAGYKMDIMLDHACDYLFPFFWKGYNVEVKYSYRLEEICDREKLWAGLGANIRTDIKKAMKTVAVEENHPIDDLILLQEKTFARQGRNSLDTGAVIRRIDEAAAKHNARKLLCAVDEFGRIHAAAYFVHDSDCCYYLIGGGDPELRNSGAGSLLVWEGIRHAATVSRHFDFEGSMLEPVERHFRAFGAVPTPYWHITKMNLPLRAAAYAKPLIKKVLGWQ